MPLSLHRPGVLVSQSPAAGTAPNVTVLHLALVAGLFTVLAVFLITGLAQA